MSAPKNPKAHSTPRKSTLPAATHQRIKNNQIRDETAGMKTKIRKLKARGKK